MAKKVKQTSGTEAQIPDSVAAGLPVLFGSAGASNALLTQEQINADDLKGFRQLSLPPIVKPREMPVGAMLHGTITGIMDSPIKEYKNRVLQMTRPNDGFRFCFPLTAVISKALGNNDAEQDAHIGDTILIKKTGTSKSKKGKKDMNLFEVYLKPRSTVSA